MIFAICLVPIVLLMGGAIDFSRQRSGESRAQEALDAALLAVARGSNNKSEAQLTREAREWFVSHLGDAPFVLSSFSVTKTDDAISAKVSGGVQTALLGLIGLDRLAVNRTATVSIGLTKVELALVLDTTGSMNETPRGQSKTKIQSLIDAALDLTDIMSGVSGGSDKIEMALVPFSTYVNVGMENIDAEWMDSEARSPVHVDNLLIPGLNRFDLYDHLGYDWLGCVMARPAPHDVLDTKPRTSDPETLFVPIFHPDEPDDERRGRPVYPNNYVDDATYTLGTDLLDIGNPLRYGLPIQALAQIEGVPNRLLRAILNAECEDGDDDNQGRGQECNNGNGNGNGGAGLLNPANWTAVVTNPDYSNRPSPTGPSYTCDSRPITPLTTHFQTIRNEIRSLEAVGTTNLAQGVVWGWHVLSEDAPFSQGDRYSEKVQKVIVLLSDGNNFIGVDSRHPGGSDFSAYGYMENDRLEGVRGWYDSDEVFDAMDDRTLLACNNAKAAGIRVFTIRLSMEDRRSEELLSACASSPSDFIDVQNSDDLANAFQDIADRISTLYLSH